MFGMSSMFGRISPAWHHPGMSDHHPGMSEQEIREIITDYEDQSRRLIAERNARLRAAREAGWKPKDLMRLSGYSRETIRQALNPEICEQIKARRRKPPT